MSKTNWNYIVASSYCIKVTDGTHDSPKSTDFGNPLITSKHIKGRNIDFANAYLISVEDYEKINQRSKVDQWDILISMIGEYCGFCYVERNKEINYAVKNVGIYKTGSKIKAEWLYYYLNSVEGKNSLLKLKGGSSQPYLTLGVLRTLPILFPNKETEAEKIINILSSLDSKIEINNRINAELEAMAKTLYDYWFVQFDFPNAKGKPYESSGGKMIWNEELKREIPEGWEVAKMNSKIKIGSGHPFNSETYLTSGIYKIITIKNVQELNLDTTTVDYVNSIPDAVPDFCKLQTGDILMSLTGNVGRICLVTEENLLLNQRVGKILCDKLFSNYLYLFYQRPEEKYRLENIATGSSQKNLSPVDAVGDYFFFPPDNLLEKFNSITDSIINKTILNYKENQKLSELRDWLLPMLMNGQVKVKDAEDMLAMAAEPKEEYGSKKK